MSGKVWTWTEMYFNDWTFLWMAGNGLERPKRAGNRWKQRCCLLIRLQLTRTQQFYWKFAALCPPLCSSATSPYAKKVWMLGDSTSSVLRKTGPSCGSALKWALADWCCYGFCRLESRNQQCTIKKICWANLAILFYLRFRTSYPYWPRPFNVLTAAYTAMIIMKKIWAIFLFSCFIYCCKISKTSFMCSLSLLIFPYCILYIIYCDLF